MLIFLYVCAYVFFFNLHNVIEIQFCIISCELKYVFIFQLIKSE